MGIIKVVCCLELETFFCLYFPFLQIEFKYLLKGFFLIIFIKEVSSYSVQSGNFNYKTFLTQKK